MAIGSSNKTTMDRNKFTNDASYETANKKLAEGNSSNNYYMDYVDASKVEYTVEDGGYSAKLTKKLDELSDQKVGKTVISDLTPESLVVEQAKKTNLYTSLYHANNLRMDRREIYSKDRIFNQTFRFGLNNPYGQLSTAKEFVFFTKPDLHLMHVDDTTGIASRTEMNRGLEAYFWKDIFRSKKRIIESLQAGYTENDVKAKDPFNHLLQNCLISNVEVPSLSSTSIETSTNTYGVSLSYRGSSEDSDDGPEFSLEFRDDRYLNVYTFFRAYEEYETLKKHGIIKPQKQYIFNKILHDQFAIYKFIVDEDMETILYWGKYYGVYPVSLPRDAFNNDNFQDGLSFSINFKAAFYEDMRPEILFDFNRLSKEVFDSCKYRIDIYNDALGRMDGRAVKAAMVYTVTGDPRAQQNPNQYYYKLVWRGDDTV